MSDSENDEYYREKLERHRVDVVQSLDLDRQFMLSYLRSNGIIDEEDEQLILNTGVTKQQKNSKLLDVLATRGKKAYQSFINALEYEHAELYEKFTGIKSKNNAKSSTSVIVRKFADCDAMFLAKELARISDQYTKLACVHEQTQQENKKLKKEIHEHCNKLRQAEEKITDLNFQICLDQEESDCEDEETKETINHLFIHNQSVTQENHEKSQVIISLQARLLAVYEDLDQMSRKYEDLKNKNQTLIHQLKDLTIDYDFRRIESNRLKKESNKNISQLTEALTQQMQLKAARIKLAKVNQENDELNKKLEEYRNVVTALNAKLSLLNEQKSAEYERRSEISEEYLKARQKVKISDLEKRQAQSVNEYQKERILRLEGEVSTCQEQILFLTGELEKTVNERNRSMKEREEVTQYNNQLIKSRDEAIQNQIEVSRKLEFRYEEVSNQLEVAREELRKQMMMHIKSISTTEGKRNCDIFESELLKTRKMLSFSTSDLDEDDKPVRDSYIPENKSELPTEEFDVSNKLPNIECEDESENEFQMPNKECHDEEIAPLENVTKRLRRFSVLDEAKEILKGRGSKKTEDHSLSIQQLTWVYDGLKGHDGDSSSFGNILLNPVIFPFLNKGDKSLGLSKKKKKKESPLSKFSLKSKQPVKRNSISSGVVSCLTNVTKMYDDENKSSD